MSSVCDIYVCYSVSSNLTKHSSVAAEMIRDELVKRENTPMAYVPG